MAASMVSTRIFLSIPFSLATCSRMNPRLVSVPDVAACVAMTCLSVSLLFAGLRPPALGLSRKLENQVGAPDVLERSRDRFAIHFQGDGVALHPENLAAQHTLAVGGGANQMKLGEAFDGAFVVPRRPQGSLDPGRAHLEV